jgi:menaquinone-dependent protoporphyrinogen oxidase
VVIGGAAYMFHWLKDATAFARRHRKELANRPVWLFSSGPLGPDKVDTQGQDALKAARPKEFDELVSTLEARGEQVFFGAYDPEDRPIGMGERVVRMMPAAKTTLPAGDFRDWAAIDAWADTVAKELERDTRT